MSIKAVNSVIEGILSNVGEIQQRRNEERKMKKEVDDQNTRKRRRASESLEIKGNSKKIHSEELQTTFDELDDSILKTMISYCSINKILGRGFGRGA